MNKTIIEILDGKSWKPFIETAGRIRLFNIVSVFSDEIDAIAYAKEVLRYTRDLEGKKYRLRRVKL